MTWAWTVPLPPTPKLVLMALADEADDRGYCFPSQRRLADKCSITERSVRRMLALLVELERIGVEQRFKKDGGRTSNGYRILVETPRTNCPGGADSADRGERTAVSGGIGHRCPGAPDTGVRVTTTYPCLYPKSQPLPGGVQNADPLAPNPGVSGSSDLYFPKTIAEAQRQALRRQLKNLNPNQAQQVLDELAGRMSSTQVRNPIGYCASLVARVQRGEFQPELGVEVARQRQAERQRQGQLREPQNAHEVTGQAKAGVPEDVRAWLRRSRSSSRWPPTQGDHDINQTSAPADENGEHGPDEDWDTGA